jgi:transcription elongation GreA/GreB family factor
MCPTSLKEKKIKDLTVEEFRQLLQESIAEDIDAWRETLEIMADKKLMKRLEKADKEWEEKGEAAYVEWPKKKPHV